MFIVYILYSGSLDRYYVGYTEDMVSRLRKHNSDLGSTREMLFAGIVKGGASKNPVTSTL